MANSIKVFVMVRQVIVSWGYSDRFEKYCDSNLIKIVSIVKKI